MSIETDIAKEFGKGVLYPASELLDIDLVTIPVSPSLDMILGGGLQEGSFVIFTGPPKCGKTSTALHFAANAQNPEYGGEFCPEGRNVYYFSIEGRLTSRDLRGIPNLNMDKFRIIGSKPGNILTGERILSIAEKLINSKKGDIFIIDSYSALSTENELASEMDAQQRAEVARLLAKFCRKIKDAIPINRTIVIGITHLMANPSGYGGLQEKGGNALWYQTDFKIKAKKVTPWKLNENGIQIGQIINWTCVTSALGPPGLTTDSYLRYGQGLDEKLEVLNLAEDFGLIQLSGAWFSFNFLDEKDPPKFQGREKSVQALKDNPKWYKILESKVKEIL